MIQKQIQKYNFHVNGMHCNSCVLLIEDKLKDHPQIENVKVKLSNHSIEIEGNFEGIDNNQIVETLSNLIKENGYSLSLEKQNKNKNLSDFKIAIPTAIMFMILFVFLQKTGFVNLVGGQGTSYGTAFIIGIIASLSTCMAVVGGLLLSMSATFAKEGDKIKPQVLFHVGRIISYFILGGVIGSIGSAFTLNTTMTFILGLVIGFVMLILGINLLDVFHFTKKMQISMPKFIGKQAHGVAKFNHTLTPFFVGILTFFLPCGFTQSMQLYTLSTGSFIGGALTMLSFALGTLPVLALISFSSFSIKNNSKSGIFFKTAGLIVILFSLFNIINSLVIIGLIPPIFNF